MKVRRAFTLGELLVVVVILAVLASLLFPVFGKARDCARLTQDIAQSKQIYEAIVLYEQDHSENSPHSLVDTLGYLKSRAVYCSPADPYAHGVPGATDFPGDMPVVDSVRSTFRISYNYAYPCLAVFGFDEKFWAQTYRQDASQNMLDFFYYNPPYPTILPPSQVDLYRVRTFLNQIRCDGSYRGVHVANRFGDGTGLNGIWDTTYGLL